MMRSLLPTRSLRPPPLSHRMVALLAAAGLACAGCASDGAEADAQAPLVQGIQEVATSTITAPPPPPPTFVDGKRPGIPNTASGYRVAIYGDSLAHSVQEELVENLDAGGRLETSLRIFAGAALCDFLDDVLADAEAASTGQPLWGAVLMFSNNTFTSCMAGPSGAPLEGGAALDRFESDLREAVAALTAAGARVWIPTLPTNRSILLGAPDEITPVNEVAARIAAEFELAEIVDAAASVLNPDGSYAETLPCLPLEPCLGGPDDAGVGNNFVREPDGVHFCTGGYGEGVDIVPGNCPTYSSGAYRYGLAVTAPIIAAASADWATETE